MKLLRDSALIAEVLLGGMDAGTLNRFESRQQGWQFEHQLQLGQQVQPRRHALGEENLFRDVDLMPHAIEFGP